MKKGTSKIIKAIDPDQLCLTEDNNKDTTTTFNSQEEETSGITETKSTGIYTRSNQYYKKNNHL